LRINIRENADKLRSEHGLTLLEMIIVIVIIGIMATAIAARFVSFSRAAEAAACHTNQLSLETAQSMFFVDKAREGNGYYADDIDLLLPYLQGGQIPVCPGGGTYELFGNEFITCSIPEHQR